MGWTASRNPMSDIALARRVLAGDEAAFDEFFAACFPPLYRFALARLGGDEDTAEEVVQRVLIRALDRLHTYRGEAALLTWVCTLCRREIAAWLGRAGRAQDISLSDDRPEMRAVLNALTSVAGGDPEAALSRRELSGLVQLTLDYLPARYGDVLEWKYIEELSVGEIADRLGVGYKAAESLLSRARAAFREGFSFVSGNGPEIPGPGRPRHSEGS
jgi:RNA polymerase sigma-70 factor (ECF subfamily)